VLLEVEERQLTERISRSVNRDGQAVAEIAFHAGGEAALDDQVERVGRIATVEHHLGSVEAATLGDRNQAPELRLGQFPEQVASEHR
jgi:hypothetical protein